VRGVVMIIVQICVTLLGDVVPKYCVHVVYELTDVAVRDEGLVIDSEVCNSGEFETDHLKLLLLGSPGRIDIEVNILDVDHHKLGQTVSCADRRVFGLVVCLGVKLIRAHGVDIDHVDMCCHLVHEAEWADTSE